MKTRLILCIYLVLFLLTGLSGEEVSVEGRDYFLDIPEGWKVMDASELSAVSFTDPARKAILQVITFTGTSFPDVESIFRHIKTQLKTSGDGAFFTYNGRDACIADLTFAAGGGDARGYFICINDDVSAVKKDFILMAYVDAASYDAYAPYILSVLDSFSIDRKSRVLPGPVSQFFYPHPGPQAEDTAVTINGKQYFVEIDRNEIEASQLVVEREALILSAYPKGSLKAWNRFFRMIYRDNVGRLAPYYGLFKTLLAGKSQLETAQALLSWVQGFEYVRINSISDILSPFNTALSGRGDCDSRAVLYISLLHYFGIDAVLFVSLEYSHAGAGVHLDVRCTGARIAFEGREYMFAEVTADVNLGMVDQTMANPDKWIPMRLEMTEGN